MAHYLVRTGGDSPDYEPVWEIVEADSALEAVAQFVDISDSFEVWSLRTLEPRRYRLVTETSIQRI